MGTLHYPENKKTTFLGSKTSQIVLSAQKNVNETVFWISSGYPMDIKTDIHGGHMDIRLDI